MDTIGSSGNDEKTEINNWMDRKEVLVSAEEMERQQSFAEMIRALPHRPKSYHVVTYGCQMNAHDSEKIAGMLESMGMVSAPQREEADFVIFCLTSRPASLRQLIRDGDVRMNLIRPTAGS